ncbi:hypothetical protein KKH43_05250 [Patescibacteria group bacterium]|nr:hypothetical protein [Patescibacteria group bacterium]
MDPNLKEKAKKLLQSSKNILLVTRMHPQDDSIGSLLALGLVFEKLGKEISLVCHGPFTSSLSFLPNHDQIGTALQDKNNFIITLDTTQAKVSQFSYDFDNDGNKLNIYITPEDGTYDSSHVETQIKARYDLIVVVDVRDLEDLGPLYTENTKLFFETPIVNIDNDHANTQFGEVNWVNPKAATTSEVAFEFISSIGEDLINENSATSLLAGIIAETKSFQRPDTTSQAFNVAARLIQAGADQQQIIHNMFKNKSLNTLRLWGRALMNVAFIPEEKIIVTSVTQDDFDKTDTSNEDVLGLEEELLENVGNADVVVICVENKEGTDAFIKPISDMNMHRLNQELRGVLLHDRIKVERKGVDIEEAKKEIMASLRTFMGKTDRT